MLLNISFGTCTLLRLPVLGITRILHESEAFICKALKGEAIVNYASPLITQQMEASGSPNGLKLMQENDFHPLYLIVIFVHFSILLNLLSLNVILTSH